jgi:hypothetical protein
MLWAHRDLVRRDDDSARGVSLKAITRRCVTDDAHPFHRERGATRLRHSFDIYATTTDHPSTESSDSDMKVCPMFRCSITRAQVLVAVLSTGAFSSSASADDSAYSQGSSDQGGRDLPLDPYCERVREAANSTASVLLGPRVVVAAIKFPLGGDLQGTGAPTGSLYQMRAYGSWSVTNAYQGLLSLQLGDADCKRQRLAHDVEGAIRLASNQGRKSALLAEVAFLMESEPTISNIADGAEGRRRAGVSTVVELAEIRSLVAALRTTRLEAQAAVGELDATPLPEPVGPIGPDAQEYSRVAMDYERIDSRIRQVAPWGMNVSGGVASSSVAAVDWFGTVEVSYNLGGLGQVPAERALLSARRRELETSSTELEYAARAVDASLKKSVSLLKSQIELLADAEKGIEADLAAVTGAPVPDQMHAAAALKLRWLALRAQLVYLRALSDRRRPWEAYHEP